MLYQSPTRGLGLQFRRTSQTPVRHRSVGKTEKLTRTTNVDVKYLARKPRKSVSTSNLRDDFTPESPQYLIRYQPQLEGQRQPVAQHPNASTQRPAAKTCQLCGRRERNAKRRRR
jgi:hypothetical protein